MNDQYASLVVTSAILMLPIIPAAIIYLLLTPKNAKNKNESSGEYEGQFFNAGKFKMRFNVFGSTATYILVLVAGYLIHSDIERQHQKQLSMQNQQAWLVEVPVKLRDENGPLQANNQEMQQVMVTLEPGNLDASASRVEFWVVPSNEKFPTANFSMAGALNRETLDLNSEEKVIRDHSKRKLTSTVPVWLEVGAPYAQ